MSPDPIAFLRDALLIRSVSGQEAEIARHLSERCADFADRSSVDAAGNLVVEVGRGPLELMVLGHLDTVPGVVPVRIEDGRLYGRGSVDAKGPLCCALLAAERLSTEARRAVRFTVIGAVEEEARSRGARALLAARGAPDLLVVAEPSGWDAVTLGYKGRSTLVLAAEKPNRHSAEDIPTAAADVVEAWCAVRAWAESDNEGVSGVFDRVQATLTELASSGDGLVQRASARIGFRLPPRTPPADLERALAALAWPGSVSIRFEPAEQPFRGPRDTVLTRAFRSAIRAAGGRPVTKVKTGTSDMNVVAPHWPIPMLAYGPGDSRLDHTADEHVVLDEFERAIRVLTAVVERIAARDYSPDSS